METTVLPARWHWDLLVIGELYRQLALPFMRLFEWLFSGLVEIENLFQWSSSRAANECRWAMASIVQ